MRIKPVNRKCKYCKEDGQIVNALYQLTVGSILKEQYLIGKAIGQGGFGITYIGWDDQSNRRVAVKEYYLSGIVVRDGTASPEVACTDLDAYDRFTSGKDRFLREYKALSELSEISGIVQVRDFFSENNTAYIVMEYIEGINLRQYVKEQGGKLSGSETFWMLRPIMHSLEKVHNAGLIHRDVSPDNIMVLEDGSVKLLDFGAAHELSDYTDFESLTKATEALYKQGYAPLEQYQSKGKLGSWTDVYALCATACYCLTGRKPPEALERLMMDTPVLLRKAGADLSEYEENVLQKGMELRVEDRIADMKELHTALFDSNDNQESQEEKVVCIDHKKTLFQKRWWLFLFVCVLAFGIVTVFGYHRKPHDGNGNKVIALPFYLEDIPFDRDSYNEFGTWFHFRCGTVEAFSDSYTFSCSLYLPKRIFEVKSSQIQVECWLDMDAEADAECNHLGTTDGMYRLKLIHENDETFFVVHDSLFGEIQQPTEYTDYFELHDAGNYYKLEIKDLPYHSEMHGEEPWNSFSPIDTGCGGIIAPNIKVSGAGRSLSSFVYLDDIVIKDHGKVIRSFDCSMESLYIYEYRYIYERSGGEEVDEENWTCPDIETIYPKMQ